MIINNGDKIGIIGQVGSGKTTLLKALIDNEMLEEGVGEEKFNIYKQGNPNIGYLKQIEFENKEATLLDEILKVYKNITDIEEKIETLERKMQENQDEKLIKSYTESLDKYELLGGYTYKKE